MSNAFLTVSHGKKKCEATGSDDLNERFQLCRVKVFRLSLLAAAANIAVKCTDTA